MNEESIKTKTKNGECLIYKYRIVSKEMNGNVYNGVLIREIITGEKTVDEVAIKHIFKMPESGFDEAVLQFNHANIIKIHDYVIFPKSDENVFSDPPGMIIIMDNYEFNLAKFIKSQKVQSKVLPKNEKQIHPFKCEWVKQMIKAMMYLHEEGVVSIGEPSQFLIKREENDWVLKLNGVSFPNSNFRFYKSPEHWRPFEIKQEKKDDVWAFGITFVQLFGLSEELYSIVFRSSTPQNLRLDSDKFCSGLYSILPNLKEHFPTVLPMIFVLRKERKYFDEIYDVMFNNKIIQ
jgi:serine/threonine protein kinase